MNLGFIKLIRGPDLDDLLRDPAAFAILTQVATRARRSGGYDVHGLAVGEAFIGDHKKVGLTRQSHRTRLRRLVKDGFLTTRPTNKGTIARLTSTRVFDINSEETNQQANQRATSSQPSMNHQATTNKKGKNEKKESGVALSLEDAIAKYDPLFPEINVRGSLSKMVRKGRLLTPAKIEDWLKREKEARPTGNNGAKPHRYTEQQFQEWKDTLQTPPSCTLDTADDLTLGHFRQYMLGSK